MDSTTATTTTATAAPIVAATTAPVAAAPGAPATTTPYANASLYVGDLRTDVTETQLFDIFKNVGTVASIRICRDAVTRRSLGYAYVNFHNSADAERALDTLNYTLINNKPCRVMWSSRDPARRRTGTGNIFIKNLDKTVSNQQLYDTFSAFGNILSCKVDTDDAGISKGYGYVHFEREADATNSVEKVNGMLIAGKKVYVGPFKSRRDMAAQGPKETYFTNVYVKNLDEAVDEVKLTEMFSKFGEITSAALMKDPETGKPRGFGFVNFKDHESAKKAIAEYTALGAAEKEKEKEAAAAAAAAVATTAEKKEGSEEPVKERSKVLVVCRAQKKYEREAELKRKFEQLKMERAQHLGTNLYVRNLDDNIDDDELRQLFAPFGNITSAKVMREAHDPTPKKDAEGKDLPVPKAGQSKGFGFVCYSSAEEAHKAINELNGVLIRNKPLYVALAQKKEVRRAQLEAHHAQQRMRMATAMNFMPGAMPAGMPVGMPGAPIFYGAMPPQVAASAAQMQFLSRQQNPMMRQQWAARQGVPQGPQGQQQQGGRPQQMQQQQQGGYQQMRRGGMGAQQGGRRGGAQQGQAQQYPSGRFKISPAARNPQFAQQQAAAPVQQVAEPVAAAPAAPVEAVAQELAPLDLNMPPAELKQAIGERLFGIVFNLYPTDQQRCGKITGMLLESMPQPDLIKLLDDKETLAKKIDEANQVYEEHQRKLTATGVDASFAQEAQTK